MEVEKINENTIRVTMDKAELEQRGITVLDLLGNKKEIQSLFASILQEADVDHNFSPNDPVTFQIMPANGGLEMIISKANKEQLNKWNQMKQKSNGGVMSDEGLIPQDMLDGLDEALKNFHSKKDSTNTQNIIPTKRGFKFNNIEEVIALAENLKVTDIASALYYDHGQYIMDLAFLDDNYVELTPEDAWAIAEEYGNEMNDSELKLVKQYGKEIISRDALANLRYYFVQKK